MKCIKANWYETKIKYEKTFEDGNEHKVLETYVVAALSCMEAETKIIENMKPFLGGEYKVTSAGEAKYQEIFLCDDNEGEKFYKAKVAFITVDEKTEKEKLTNVLYLVQADSLPAALKNIQDEFGSTGLDYTILGLNETKIIDVLPSD